MKFTLCWVAFLLGGLAGCSQPGQVEDGSETAARAHLAAELDKWMADQETEAMTIRGARLAPPIGYEFRSVVPEKPEVGAWADGTDIKTVTDYESWPAYRFNVCMEWRSQADTRMEKVTMYTLIWNPHEKKWYVRERF
ncbi:MAG: hypothetical protein GXY83_02945 [Rhodopirellula sp.]|nr:hypothetical protein [Rhodopirellula sp.]